MHNATLETIKNRRSTRAFLDRQLEDAALEAILEAGQYAPSGHNQQSWHFTVIQNPEHITFLNGAAKKAAAGIEDETIRNMVKNPGLDIFYGAPTVVIISGNDTALTPLQDCDAATQNMLLAAESLGLGSCWNGLAAFAFKGDDGERLRERFAVPAGYTPMNAIVLGYRKSAAAAAPKRKEGAVNYIR